MRNCDYWEVLEITNKDKTYNVVIAEKRGGYLDSNYWRRSSPIKEYIFENNMFQFVTNSGNIYSGHINSKGLFLLTSNIYETMKNALKDNVRILSEDELRELCKPKETNCTTQKTIKEEKNQ